jgi:hypothetical protein
MNSFRPVDVWSCNLYRGQGKIYNLESVGEKAVESMAAATPTKLGLPPVAGDGQTPVKTVETSDRRACMVCDIAILRVSYHVCNDRNNITLGSCVFDSKKTITELQ